MSEELQDPGQQPVWISPNSAHGCASHLESIRRHIHPPLIIITQAGEQARRAQKEPWPASTLPLGEVGAGSRSPVLTAKSFPIREGDILK